MKSKMIRPPERVVREFIRRINRRDLEGMTRLMSERHALIDSLGRRIAGSRDTLVAAWTGYFAMVPDYAIKPKATFTRENTVIVIGTASGSYVPVKNGLSVGTWSTPATWRAIVRRGHVTEWQVYADNEPIRVLMRQTPPVPSS
jgi:hypothetical protein